MQQVFCNVSLQKVINFNEANDVRAKRASSCAKLNTNTMLLTPIMCFYYYLLEIFKNVG